MQNFPERSARGMWFGPCLNTYPRPQVSQEPPSEYPAASTSPAAHARHGSTMPAKQGSLRATLARLRSSIEKTIQLLCKASRASEWHVWHTSTCFLLSWASQSPYSLFFHELEVLFSYLSFNCRKGYRKGFQCFTFDLSTLTPHLSEAHMGAHVGNTFPFCCHRHWYHPQSR